MISSMLSLESSWFQDHTWPSFIINDLPRNCFLAFFFVSDLYVWFLFLFFSSIIEYCNFALPVCTFSSIWKRSFLKLIHLFLILSISIKGLVYFIGGHIFWLPLVHLMQPNNTVMEIIFKINGSFHTWVFRSHYLLY